jgi:hypothetical protein
MAIHWCLVGAVWRVYDDDWAAWSALERIAQMIQPGRDHTGRDHNSAIISRWNDAPERTHAEVLDLAQGLGI